MPRRALTRLTLLVVAVAWPLIAGDQALAVESWMLTAPGAGTTITAPVGITASATGGPDEQIERVEARLVPGSQPRRVAGQIVRLDYVEGPTAGGTSRWVTSMDPLASWGSGGGPLPNGPYQLEVRAVSGTGATGWHGHDVLVDAPPPATSVRVTPTPEGVAVSWGAVRLPDFTRYTLQRSVEGASWTDVVSLPEPDRTTHVDTAQPADGTAPPAGSVRYRVLVARASATGGERTSESEPATVEVAEGVATPAPSASAPSASASPSPVSPSPSPSASAVPSPSPSTSGPLVPSGPRRAQPPAVRRGFAVIPPAAPSPPPAALVAPPGQVALPEEIVDSALGTIPVQPSDGERADESEEPETVAAIADEDPGGTLTVIGGREVALQSVLPPLAGGLVLVLSAAHVLRFRNG